MGVEVVSRLGWGAREPRSRSRMVATHRDRVFIHWPGMSKNLSDIDMLHRAQNYHMDTLGWSDIGYSFAVGRDGKCYELRGINIVGGHTRGENSDSYGIVCLLGVGEKPTAKMLETLPHMIEHIRSKDPLMGRREKVVVVGHRHDQQANTQCPGNDLAKWAWNYKHSRDYKPATTTITNPVDQGATRAQELLLRMAIAYPYQFITQTYIELLGRQPSHKEIVGWLKQYTKFNKEAAQTVYWSVENSNEAKKVAERRK